MVKKKVLMTIQKKYLKYVNISSQIYLFEKGKLKDIIPDDKIRYDIDCIILRPWLIK